MLTAGEAITAAQPERCTWPACGESVSRLHGLVSLEIAGNFASMGVDPDQVLEARLGALAA